MSQISTHDHSAACRASDASDAGTLALAGFSSSFVNLSLAPAALGASSCQLGGRRVARHPRRTSRRTCRLRLAGVSSSRPRTEQSAASSCAEAEVDWTTEREDERDSEEDERAQEAQRAGGDRAHPKEKAKKRLVRRARRRWTRHRPGDEHRRGGWRRRRLARVIVLLPCVLAWSSGCPLVLAWSARADVDLDRHADRLARVERGVTPTRRHEEQVAATLHAGETGG